MRLITSVDKLAAWNFQISECDGKSVYDIIQLIVVQFI